jgi:hypothetical protein
VGGIYELVESIKGKLSPKMFQGINMAKDSAPAEVSDDGKRLTSRSIDGHTRWMKCAPSVEEWSGLAKYPLGARQLHEAEQLAEFPSEH